LPKILFLDDSTRRARHFRAKCPGSTWVKTAERCIAELGEESWDEVHLDHDLGAKRTPGMAVVEHMKAHKPDHLQDTSFVVHSLNVPAAELMVEGLESAGYECEYRPFPWVYAWI
jgi:hypothetical protein